MRIAKTISLQPKVDNVLAKLVERRGQDPSTYISSLILKANEDERWERIYRRGALAVRELGITSEENVARIIDASRS